MGSSGTDVSRYRFFCCCFFGDGVSAAVVVDESEAVKSQPSGNHLSLRKRWERLNMNAVRVIHHCGAVGTNQDDISSELRYSSQILCVILLHYLTLPI